MKNRLFLIVTLAAAVSCADRQFEPLPPAGQTVRFRIDSEQTKTLLTSDYRISWEAGKDEVSLFSKSNNYRFSVVADGTSTWLEGTIGETTSRYYAIYPYDPSATNSTGFVTTVLPSQQKAVRNQFSNILAVGSTQDKDLRFRNCVTLVEVDLQTDGVSSISLCGNNGELIAGTVRISIPSKEDTDPVTTVISGSKEVSISDGGAVLQKGRYYLAVVPQTFSRGITVTLSGKDGSARRLTTNSVTATRSKRLLTGPLNLSLTQADGSFCFSYDDGEHSGTIYPGEQRSLVYTYSGHTGIKYSVSGAGYTAEYFPDGSTSPADASDRLGSGFTGASGSVSLLPASPSGGINDNVERLRSASVLGSQSSPADLSTANNNTLGAGLRGANTANCYIVRAPGWYSFPLVYGNALKGNLANTGAYSPSASGGTVLKPFVDAYGQAITSPWINEGAHKAVSARIEWQDALGLLADEVSVKDNSVVFHVPAGTIREGNAVISALDDSGHVLWSWHIWVTGATDEQLMPVEVTNKSSKEFSFMRINLGWVAPYSSPIEYPSRSTRVRLTENGSGKVLEFTILQLGATLPANELGCSPFWQWGRKDPFVSGDGTAVTDAAGNFRKKTWYTTSRRDTVGTRAALLGNSIAAFISNPSTYNVTSNGDNKYSNAWNASQASFGSGDSIVKTVYDPCPPGYSLPPASAWNGFSTANVSGSFDNGWYFWTKPGKSGQTVFFPAAGSMSTSNSTSTSVFGSLRNIGTHCSYWSGNPNQANSAYYLFATASAVNTGYGANRQYVYPIRPIKEQ